MTSPLSTGTTTQSIPIKSEYYHQLSAFKRGIKRDSAAFPTFKDDKYYDYFSRTFEAVADAQGLGDLLDPTFKPDHSDEYAVALFHEQQKFLYSVLLTTLQTDEGKSIVRAHAKDKDAQAILRELRYHYTKSTVVRNEITRLTTYITNLCLDSSWRGTTESFIMHFKEQLRLLDDLQPLNERLPDTMRRTLLMNAVENIGDLCRIQNLVEYMQHKDSSHTITFEEYYSLLKNAAFSYDKSQRSTKHRTRQVQFHEVDDDDVAHDDILTHEDFVETLDSPSSVHIVNKTALKPKSSKPIPKSPPPMIHSGVVHFPKDTWDILPEDFKKMVFDYNAKKKGTSSIRKANVHESDTHHDATIDSNNNDGPPLNGSPLSHQVADDTNCRIINLLSSYDAKKDHSPGDIRDVLSIHQASRRQVHHHHVTYKFSKVNTWPSLQLVDRGANGGLAGDDMRILHKTGRKVDISGIDNHEVNNLDIVTCASMFDTKKGRIIGIFHEYAYLGKGRSIHSSGQLEWMGLKVDERSVLVGGRQCIETLQNHIIPISIKGGLAYIQPVGKPSAQDMDDYPHVFFTNPADWDPALLDYDFPTTDGQPVWDQLMDDRPYEEPRFDDFGDFTGRVVATLDTLTGDTPYAFYNSSRRDSGSPTTTRRDPDWVSLRPCFGWTSIQHIKDTYKITTRFGNVPYNNLMRKHYKSRNPVLNISRRSEQVATDTIYSDTPAVCSGVKSAQFFAGRKTLVCDVYPLQRDKQFINALEDIIRKRGAMESLISDRAQVLISKKVDDLLRSLLIKVFNSEPHHQHQNFAENMFGTTLEWTNQIMNFSGARACMWLLALQYVVYLRNYLASPALDGQCPLFALTGQTQDISHLTHFHFNQPVYYRIDDEARSFPSSGTELPGHWVGFGEHVGDLMTWKILTADDDIIYRSAVRPASSGFDRNRRLESVEGEVGSSSLPIFVKSRHLDSCSDQSKFVMPTINFEDLVGHTFLMPPKENGERHRAHVVRPLIETSSEEPNLIQDLKFILDIGNGMSEEVITYNELIDYIQKEEDRTLDHEQLFKFTRIIGHQGPLNQDDPHYKGSNYNVLVEWDTGETTYEPLSIIAMDDPVTCAVYAKENNLLDERGWRRFKRFVKTHKRTIRNIKRNKIKHSHHNIKYMFGYQIPRDYEEAMELDRKNGNTKWKEAIDLELKQIDDYQTFKDVGKAEINTKGQVMNAPEGYKKIRVNLVFAVKHDGRHKARLVADGHLNRNTTEGAYSGVVSLRSLRIVMFLSELNALKLWGADIGNAYLEAYTEEKIFILAGPEFGERKGHILIISKALYGLRTSGARWHDRLFDVMREMGFSPSKNDPDIWMRLSKDGEVYEYSAVYIDDLAIVAKDPAKICQILKDKFKFKLKGDGPLEYHLGCGYWRDPDGTLVADPKKYIEKMMEWYEQEFGEKPRKFKTPLEPGDHPEIDESPECSEENQSRYLTMTGQLQWLVALGRFDIFCATMTMSKFRPAPKEGHISRLKRMYGYVLETRIAAIRFCTTEPNYNDIEIPQHDWMRTVYGNVKEVIPADAPEPKGKPVFTTSYVDANLYHDIVTGKAVTAVLHLLNQTPIDWYSKKQSTVETATFGSEFSAARTATDQIVDLRNTLRYLGVPVREKSYLFGDNKSVVTNATNPTSVLSKRHHALSYHRVREAVASGFLLFQWIEGKNNPADILSKHWTFVSIFPMLKSLLLWRGETKDIKDAPTVSNKDKAN
ncbi:hypothetical protein ACA910_014422 [Epithemia clementina (nom. ined.)]